MVFKHLISYVQNLWCRNCQEYFKDDYGPYCPDCGERGGE